MNQVPNAEPPLGALACPEPEDRPDLWPTTARCTSAGELALGGLTVSEILTDAPSPVFVLDEADLRGRAASWSAAMHEEFWPSYGMAGGEAFYAGKAFLTTKVAQWVLEEGMGIDTASRGELAVGLAALQEVDGVEATTSATRVGLHGNGKTQAEIAVALTHHVGHLVLDSLEEVDLAVRAVRDLRSSGVYGPEETGKVMVRLTTGVHAGGHEFISTGHEDQKFGLSVHGGAARQAIDAIIAAPELELHGLHSHIGSQIMDLAGFREAARVVLTLRHEVAADTGHLCPEVDLGGGYGIAYTEADSPREPHEIATGIAAVIREETERLGITCPRISIEPGRSIAGPAGLTLYSVGTIKDVTVETEAGESATRRYVSVDGGMSDNARPVLYDADYSAILASRTSHTPGVLSRVVGKHCESGDIVVRDVYLPNDVMRGDILAVPATGAYCFVLSSNYNMLTRPGIVAVKDGKHRLIVRGETVDDLYARDLGLQDLGLQG